MERRENGFVSKRKFEFECVINGTFALRNNFGLAGKPAKMMTGVGVVGFDNMRM